MPFPEFPDDANGIDLERDGERARQFLQGIQGNILKGHGRDNARLVFFRFGSNLEKNQTLLRDAVKDGWTQSAWQQRELAKQFRPREVKYSGKHQHLRREVELLRFGSLSLTTWGLAAVGCVDAAGEAPPRTDFSPGSWPGSFAAGMRRVMAKAPLPEGHPSLVADWQSVYSEDPATALHGMFVIACDDPAGLKTYQQELVTWLENHDATAVHFEEGTTWRHKHRDNREPFGFVDGISQPVFFTEDRRGRDPAEWTWVDLRLSDVFITPEQSPLHAGGTFLAFVKFEQDVAAFRTHEGVVRGKLGQSDSYHHAPAFDMGRWRDGCPMHQAWSGPRPTEKDFNRFDYEQQREPDTTGCPFHAHIRKMNPRVDATDLGIARDRIIRAQPVRRGMIHDPQRQLQKRSDRGTGRWPSADVGLLFMGYMRDLSRQFEQLHNDWAVDPGFPFRTDQKVDALLGPGTPAWNWRGTDIPARGPVVKRLGGHYLYVPSLHWLSAGGRPQNP